MAGGENEARRRIPWRVILSMGGFTAFTFLAATQGPQLINGAVEGYKPVPTPTRTPTEFIPPPTITPYLTPTPLRADRPTPEPTVDPAEFRRRMLQR